MKKLALILGCMFLMGTLVGAQEGPKSEIFLGYSYLRTGTGGQVNAFNNNGGLGSLQYNFTDHIGLVGELGGFHAGNVSIKGPDLRSLDQTFFSYQFGPRFSLNKTGRITPFAHYLVGGVHQSRSFAIANSLIPPGSLNPPGVTVEPGATSTRYRTAQNAFGMTIGGGMDINISHRFAVRPFQLDYLGTHFSPVNIPGLNTILTSNGRQTFNNNTRWQNSLRYSAGLGFRFGGGLPPTPTADCTGSPNELLPDDPPVTVSAQTTNFHPKHSLDYAWTSSGGQVSGSGNTAKVDVSGVAPGSYAVKATVTDPKRKKNNVASCTMAFTVKQPTPPAVACAATPNEVEVGKPVTVSAQVSSPDQRKIASRKFSASSGSLSGGEAATGEGVGAYTTTATLDTTNAQPGPVNVTLAVTDSRGLTGSCVATVEVKPLPKPPEVVSETLAGECQFKNARRTSRVDNECKAALDDISLRLQREPNSKMIVVGYAQAEEKGDVEKLAALRAINAKSYLTQGEGKQQIDPSRIEVRRGAAAGDKKADLYFLPEGATFTKSDTVVVDESQFQGKRGGGK